MDPGSNEGFPESQVYRPIIRPGWPAIDFSGGLVALISASSARDTSRRVPGRPHRLQASCHFLACTLVHWDSMSSSQLRKSAHRKPCHVRVLCTYATPSSELLPGLAPENLN
jgi:hypothetical protein